MCTSFAVSLRGSVTDTDVNRRLLLVSIFSSVYSCAFLAVGCDLADDSGEDVVSNGDGGPIVLSVFSVGNDVNGAFCE
jgi:hypothetical protein